MSRWFRNFPIIFRDLMSGLGLFWLMVEIANHSTNGLSDSLTKSVYFFVIAFALLLIFSVYKNRPKKSFSYQLRDRDNYVEVRVGDAFDNEGALVVPINNFFDVSLDGNVKKASSLQRRLILDYYSDKDEHFESDLNQKTQCNSKHEIGTVVEIEQKGKKFFLLANSHKKENNRVESSIDDFYLSLDSLWKYIAYDSGREQVITVPLINAHHGRIVGLNRSKIIKEIIHNYIEASKKMNICDRLIISISPSDLTNWHIDLDEIDDYLSFSCKHYRRVVLSQKAEGREIKASEIQSIEN